MAQKYTVKAGDNLSKIAKQYGVKVSDITGYSSGNPNLIRPGEVLNIGGTANAAPIVPPVVTPQGKVDLSRVQEATPYEEPKSSRVEVVRTEDNPDGTSTNYLSNGSSDRGKYTRNADGTLNFVSVDDPNGKSFKDISFDALAPKDQFNSLATDLRAEITAIEERMANRDGNRNDMLDDAGVFDDLKKLNDLKAELRAAEDRDIEIPIEARQKLRGNQATKTEFAQETRPQLENNLLRTLAATRNVSGLTDTINSNIAVIDSKIKADTARDEFLYTQKKDRLNKVEAIYGNIITEEQKAALEAKKFQYDLALEGIRSDNSLRNDLIKDIAKRGVGGVQLQGIMDASIDELLTFSSSLTNPSRWSEMTFEEAAMTLDPDSFKQYEAYKKWEKDATEEEKAAVNQGLAVGQSARNTIQLIEDLLNDKAGLSTSVGVNAFGRSDFNFLGAGVESTQFRAKAKQLLSQETLNKLLELKAAGGTLGAISEAELAILENAATAIGAQYDDNGKATGTFAFKEEEFKTALETMRMASMKTYIASRIGKEAFARAGYQNLTSTNADDFNTINKRYKDLLANPPEAAQNFYESDYGGGGLESAFEVIKKEEGFSDVAYQDQTGKWTIGFGNTTIGGRPVQPGDRLSKEQAESLLRSSVVENYTSFVDRIESPITPNQFAALTSFEYNLGSGVWNEPTGQKILALVESGQLDAAGRLMLQYNKSRDPKTGQLAVNSGLVNRRLREANLLLT